MIPFCYAYILALLLAFAGLLSESSTVDMTSYDELDEFEAQLNGGAGGGGSDNVRAAEAINPQKRKKAPGPEDVSHASTAIFSG